MPEPSDYEDPIGRFFAEARRAFMEDVKRLDLDHDEIVQIVADRVMRHEFQRRFQAEINDPDLKKLILLYLESIAEKLEESADISEMRSELLDRVGLGVPASVTATAIVALVATGGIGAIALLTGGLTGMAAAGVGRYILRSSALRNKAAAKKLRQLLANLK